MKKYLLMMSICGMMIFIFNACNKNKSEAYDDYRKYVTTKVDSADRYFDREWDELERDYEAKKANVDRDIDKLDDKTKAEYRELDDRWNKFKAEYQDHRTQKDMETFRSKLLPADVSNDFSNVGPDRLLAVYTYFVDYVDNHKDEFTREQWDQIELLYERLDTHKNEVEKNLPSGDNGKIATQKLRYAAIKTVNRPTTKPEENEKAKEKAE